MQGVTTERAAVVIGTGQPVDGYRATYEGLDVEAVGYSEEDALADLVEKLIRMDPRAT